MGIFWTLIHQSKIEEQKGKAESLEAKVASMTLTSYLINYCLESYFLGLY